VSSGLTLSVVGAAGLSAEIGKKGTESDLRLYHHVTEGHALTLVEPVQYPEKYGPLLQCLALGDSILLVADALDKGFAESAATADLFTAPVRIVKGTAVGEEELRRVLRGLRFEQAPLLPRDPAKLRAQFEAESAPTRNGPTQIRLDHAFPVKGVGTVALGFVRQGTLHAHDSLRLYPSAAMVEVRSIQVHDVDVKEATCGERVGVALRGIEPDELSRGAILAREGELRAGRTLSAHAVRKGAYYRGTLAAGRKLQALVGAQLVPAELTSVSADAWSLEMDRDVVWSPGDSILLADLNAPAGPRGAGAGTLE
jgi:selenocysteine-specific translation elongation factor